MPAANAAVIVGALLEAFSEAGAPAIVLSSDREHPRRFLVPMESGNEEVWIYVWTLTHGGRPNLPDELRIQMTGVVSPLRVNPLGATPILGYHQETGAFAGFDLTRHSHFTAGSSSVQVDIACVNEAVQQGLSFGEKSNQEIAIGLRSDQIVNYMVHAADFHRHGKKSRVLRLLKKASTLEEIEEGEIGRLDTKPRRVVQTVSRPG